MIGWKIAAASSVVALAAGAAGGWTAASWLGDAEIATLKAKHAAEVVQATESRIKADKAVTEAGSRLAELAQGVVDDLQIKQAQIERDRASLRDDARRLRDAFATSAAADRQRSPGAAADPRAATPAELVRTNVLGSLADRTVELAGAVDEQHAYAVACAARYRQVDEKLRALRETISAQQ